MNFIMVFRGLFPIFVWLFPRKKIAEETFCLGKWWQKKKHPNGINIT